GSRFGSPQRGSSWQVDEQPSPSVVLPSSHSSPTSTTLSPHDSRRQNPEQPSPPTLLPSSHCSPASMMPLPQSPVCTEARHETASTVDTICELTTLPNIRSMFCTPPRRWQ